MRKTVAKRLQGYATRHGLVPADYRRLKKEWNGTPTNERAKMAKMVEG